jgi:hypothetical protein
MRPRSRRSLSTAVAAFILLPAASQAQFNPLCGGSACRRRTTNCSSRAWRGSMRPSPHRRRGPRSQRLRPKRSSSPTALGPCREYESLVPAAAASGSFA